MPALTSFCSLAMICGCFTWRCAAAGSFCRTIPQISTLQPLHASGSTHEFQRTLWIPREGTCLEVVQYLPAARSDASPSLVGVQGSINAVVSHMMAGAPASCSSEIRCRAVSYRMIGSVKMFWMSGSDMAFCCLSLRSSSVMPSPLADCSIEYLCQHCRQHADQHAFLSAQPEAYLRAEGPSEGCLVCSVWSCTKHTLLMASRVRRMPSFSSSLFGSCFRPACKEPPLYLGAESSACMPAG